MAIRFFLLAVLTLQCYTANIYAEKISQNDKEAILEAAEGIDDLTLLHEEYGTASLSALLISSLNSKDGLFDLNRKSDDYFADAQKNVQGGIAQMLSEANSFSATVTGKYNPIIAKQYISDLAQFNQDKNLADSYTAKQIEFCDQLKLDWINEKDSTLKANKQDKYKTCIDNLKTSISPSNPTPDTTQPDLPADSATQANGATTLLKDPNLMKGFGSMIGDLKPTITDREAIAIAAGDKATEIVYRIIGNPAEANKFKDKTIMLAASTVSVNPGWRTRRDYAAKISGYLRLEYNSPRQEYLEKLNKSQNSDIKEILKYNNSSNIPPEYIENSGANEKIILSVVAVSPLTDSQTLDLSDSKRNAVEISMKLAGALRELSLDAQAQVFEQWAKIYQQDSKSRTVNVTTNSYSKNGNEFGYVIYPKFQALDNGEESDDSPTNIMGPQSFPVLIVIGIDNDTLHPKYVNKNPGQYELSEPSLILKQTSDWVPLRKNWFDRLFRTEWFARDIHFSDYLEKYLDMKEKQEELSRCVEKICTEVKSLVNLKKQTQTISIASYNTQEFPLEILFPTPPQDQPSISNIIPNKIYLKKQAGKIIPDNVDIYLFGKNLDKIDAGNISIDGDVVFTPPAATKLEGPVKLTLKVTGDSPVSIQLPVLNEPDYKLFSPIIKVETLDAGAGASNKTTTTPVAAAKVPVIDQVIPEKIMLKSQAGKNLPQDVDFYLIGKNLEQIDASKIEVQGDVVFTPLKGKKLSSPIKLPVKVTGNAPLYIKVPVLKADGSIDHNLLFQAITIEEIAVATSKL